MEQPILTEDEMEALKAVIFVERTPTEEEVAELASIAGSMLLALSESIRHGATGIEIHRSLLEVMRQMLALLEVCPPLAGVRRLGA